ncbi:aminopeptidase C, partial [Sporanaerobacter acetigenes]|uniref:aminopeptidase C n=1 Tax=Sporanaerobacter acetigenes TaxID=165813 RepID=UPI003334A287
MNEKAVTNELIERCSRYYNSDLNNKVYSDAVIRNGLVDVALNHEAVADMHYHFSEEIDVGDVTNQKKTGRCWMFAALNCVRHGISESLQMKDKNFELSQNYTFFWDKLEKSNLFLENIISTIDKDIDDHEVIGLLNSPVEEGGRWGLFAKLIEKYGVVPKYAMPDSKTSEDSKVLNQMLNEKMREYAKVLRKMYRENKSIEIIRDKKEEMLIDIYNILCHFLGEPPKTFDFEYRDVNGDFHREKDITPLDFYNKYSTVKPKDYIVLVNYPAEDKPFGKTYSIKYHGNVVDDEPIKYLNVDINTLKELAIAQIKGGE